MRVEAENAIKKEFFEDTLMLLGEFTVAGHDMQYLLRLSNYGSAKKPANANISAYFAMLDDTKREFVEADSNGPATEAVVGEHKLLIRKNNIEISETNRGLRMFVDIDAITIDFIVSKDCKNVNVGDPNVKFDNIKLSSYSCPSCFTYGSCTFANQYYEVRGRAIYLRSFQEKVDWTTILTRRLSRKNENEKKLFLSRGVFHLSNTNNIVLFTGEMGEQSNEWIKVVLTNGGFDQVKFLPIKQDINRFIENADNITEPTLFVIRSDDDSVRLKFKVLPLKREDLSRDSEGYVLHERFTRIAGVYQGEKVSGYGYISMS